MGCELNHSTMKKYFFYLVLTTVVFSFLIVSCSDKSDTPGANAKLEVRLTDDPGAYDEVNIDIVGIEYNVTGDSTHGWQSLAGVNTGVYNLLDLVNDKDTLLANADIPSGRLHQIRLKLGSNNSIVLNGVSYPLETPSAQQSGLKLNLQQDITAGVLYTLLLDFEAARSIVVTGNNKFILKPVIRTVLNAAGGSIAGYVQPFTVTTAVLAIQGPDTVASTFTAGNGAYSIKGLTPGSYDVHYVPTDTSYNKEIKNGIVVTAGKVTVVDTVKLVQ